MDILYIDEHIIVCVKPAGALSTDEPGGVPALLRQELKDEKADIRTVHRLDRVVGGAMLLARSAYAASTLSAEVRDGHFQKEYLAVVHGDAGEGGELRDLLLRDKRECKTYVVDSPAKGVQEARLSYKTVSRKDGLSLVSIRLHTGRTHQIRCQFSSRGLPLVGDRKYGGAEDNCPIALWSHFLAFSHPVSGEAMEFRLPPPEIYPWVKLKIVT